MRCLEWAVGTEARWCHPIAWSSVPPSSACWRFTFLHVAIWLKDGCYNFRHQNCVCSGVTQQQKAFFVLIVLFLIRETFLWRLLPVFPLNVIGPDRITCLLPEAGGLEKVDTWQGEMWSLAYLRSVLIHSWGLTHWSPKSNQVSWRKGNGRGVVAGYVTSGACHNLPLGKMAGGMYHRKFFKYVFIDFCSL